eukprot:SAG31_NODE_39302_length_289_cov_0.852632_2_plen_49_part_01
MQLSDSALQELFAALDTSGDGWISPSEFMVLLREDPNLMARESSNKNRH